MAGKVLIELFTLDSKGCAACTYTKEIVEDVIDKVDFEIEIVEHPVKEKAAVKLMQARGVKAIPTICINGDIVYESILPEEDDLIAQMKARVK